MQNKRPYPFNGCLHPAFLPLALVLGFFLFRAGSAGYSDFAGYYFGGRELLARHFENAYDMEKLNGIIRQAGYSPVFVSYAPFPPFTSLVFAPFMVFPMATAKMVFDGLSCLLFLITLMRVRVALDISPVAIVLLPVVFFIPAVNNLFFGQSYLLLCCLLLEGYLAYRRGAVWVSSLLWGVAVVFKVFPGVLLVWLLLRKKYKAALGLCVAGGLLLGLSLLLNGFSVWKYYVSEVLPKVNNGELNSPFTYVFQSAFMFFKRLFVYDALFNPHPLVNNLYLFGIVMVVFKGVVLALCISFTLRRREAEFESFALWIMASMLISPNGSSYSLVLLVIPFLALAAHGSWRRLLFGAGVLFVACNFPIDRLENASLLAQFPRLYLLLLFFGLLVWPLRAVWNLSLAVGLTAFFGLLFVAGYHRDRDPSADFFTSEDHIFINDYSVNNGVLFYSYWDGSGPHPVSTGMVVRQWEALEVKDKQIYYKGAALTHSPDVKKKPLLVNGDQVLYLSDKNRGVGFYTLRKLVFAGSR